MHRRMQSFRAAQDDQAAGAAGSSAGGAAALAAAAAAAAVEYNDSWSDVAFIGLCRIAYGNIAGYQSPRRWGRPWSLGLPWCEQRPMPAAEHAPWPPRPCLPAAGPTAPKRFAAWWRFQER